VDRPGPARPDNYSARPGPAQLFFEILQLKPAQSGQAAGPPGLCRALALIPYFAPAKIAKIVSHLFETAVAEHDGDTNFFYAKYVTDGDVRFSFPPYNFA